MRHVDLRGGDHSSRRAGFDEALTEAAAANAERVAGLEDDILDVASQLGLSRDDIADAVAVASRASQDAPTNDPIATAMALLDFADSLLAVKPPAGPGRLAAKSPPGWGGVIERWKRRGKYDNPFAVAWYLHKRGVKPSSVKAGATCPMRAESACHACALAGGALFADCDAAVAKLPIRSACPIKADGQACSSCELREAGMYAECPSVRGSRLAACPLRAAGEDCDSCELRDLAPYAECLHAASWFSECPRDEHGRCKKKGEPDETKRAERVGEPSDRPYDDEDEWSFDDDEIERVKYGTQRSGEDDEEDEEDDDDYGGGAPPGSRGTGEQTVIDEFADTVVKLKHAADTLADLSDTLTEARSKPLAIPVLTGVLFVHTVRTSPRARAVLAAGLARAASAIAQSAPSVARGVLSRSRAIQQRVDSVARGYGAAAARLARIGASRTAGLVSRLLRRLGPYGTSAALGMAAIGRLARKRRGRLGARAGSAPLPRARAIRVSRSPGRNATQRSMPRRHYTLARGGF